MKKLFTSNLLTLRGWVGGVGCLLGGLAATGVARAQVPAWSEPTVGSSRQAAGSSETRAVTTDASGDVLVVGFFTGTIAFGNAVLTSAGAEDLFVAKWVPGASGGAWAWAQRAGGTGADYGYGVAVSGSSVYVTGSILNDTNNSRNVQFGNGAVQYGATSALSNDLVLAKYTDNGSSATLGWTQVGGGGSGDVGNGVAVSGNSVYVTGSIFSNASNTLQVVFGGSGTTPGTVPVSGASTLGNTIDLVLAKYTDNGPSATLGWTQVGGGAGVDRGYGVAASGNSVYVTGALSNDLSNSYGVVFGGGGTTAGTVVVRGATSTPGQDLLVAKYTDAGAAATLNWTQVAGGAYLDYGLAVAVSGSSVYVSGAIYSSQDDSYAVRFGGDGTTAGTVVQLGASVTPSADIVVAKYTDQGNTAAFGWSQVGGGTGGEYGYGVAASGNSVYVTGPLTNFAANNYRVLFGGSGSTVGTVQVNGLSDRYSSNVVVAKYADQGTTGTLDWVRPGGGYSSYGVAAGSGGVYVGASVIDGPALNSFGSAVGSPVLGTANNRTIVAQLAAGTGAWQLVTAAFNGGVSVVKAMTTDPQGNVYVAGYFTGQAYFGDNLVSSNGLDDLFVAKYVPATRTWAWAQSAGGSGRDYAYGVAVNGTSVYLTGTTYNDRTDSYRVLFGASGTTLGTASQYGTYGAGVFANPDLVLAKYTDNGSSATFRWSQVGGGKDADAGYAVAASGNNVYVTGFIYNDLANASGVLFGGSGTTPGTAPQYGASTQGVFPDLVVAKYTDNGSTGTFGWSQVAGGRIYDYGRGIAVSGGSVYVTGAIGCNAAGSTPVMFGGSGTTPGTMPQYGTSSLSVSDLVLAKYTDNGASGTFNWSQVGGGDGYEDGYGVAVSGSSIYVAGYLQNTTTDTDHVVFGTTGTTPGTATVLGATATLSSDLVLAKYTDNGATASFVWGQVSGGTRDDYGYGLAISGNALYLTGTIFNNTANTSGVVFGGNGPTPGTAPQPGATSTASSDLVVARYTDNGSSASFNWSQVGGSTGADYGYCAAVSGQEVLVAGTVLPGAAFGSYAVAGVAGSSTTVLARLFDTSLTPLASYSARLANGLTLRPNPSHGPATLGGAAPGTPVQVLDALGRQLVDTVADARGACLLPAGLPPGLYLVRSGRAITRLVVE